MIKMMSGCLCMMMVILCGCQTRSQYIVNGHIAGYSGEVFLLSPDTTDKLDTLARADVRDGVFQDGKREGTDICLVDWPRM